MSINLQYTSTTLNPNKPICEGIYKIISGYIIDERIRSYFSCKCAVLEHSYRLILPHITDERIWGYLLNMQMLHRRVSNWINFSRGLRRWKPWRTTAKCLTLNACFFFVAHLTGQERINMKIIEATELFIVELVKKRIKQEQNKTKQNKREKAN